MHMHLGVVDNWCPPSASQQLRLTSPKPPPKHRFLLCGKEERNGTDILTTRCAGLIPGVSPRDHSKGLRSLKLSSLVLTVEFHSPRTRHRSRKSSRLGKELGSNPGSAAHWLHWL